ncbi:hypothetical protein [Bosea sp. BH3]|uniref:hypothetical protein n=1 Tax=Bosea sp. BH3 TaxID=2871701 RepID=UPI0021CB0874|nr:hypothetical protein [Bosea sp. BH3]MCU4178624.1 hypothetical protein [Bosea sp. BH3]
MHPKRRAAIIDTLAKGVEHVGSDFERFCGIVMGALSGVQMTHAGVNLRGYAVAGVVDSVSNDGKQAVEYSDRTGYFKGAMTKAEADLRKVVADQPCATEIYLVTGDRSRPQKAASFRTRVLAWPEMTDKVLHIWGSEEIATQIVEHLLLDDRIIGRLSPYLADLQRIADEEAATALVPALPSDRLPRTDVDAAIARRLTTATVLVVAGMAGVGKSLAAAAYATDHRDAYDLVIWLDGDEVKRVESLRALPLVRAGEPRNIAGLLETRACLMVIDDAGLDLSTEALSKLCGPGSHVILTRRMVTPDAYQPPLLSQTEARSILASAGTPCPDEVFQTIWASVNGHPLCLSLLRSAAAQPNTTWADLAEDCRVIGKVLDDRGERLADRLLERLKGQLQAELSVFAWAGLAAVDKAFLTHEVKPVGVRNLHAAGLTSVDRAGLVRLHDVVFAALKSLEWCDGERRAHLDRVLEEYLTTVADEPGLRLWAVARSLLPKLEAMVELGSDRGACVYALLTVWEPGEVRRDLVGDPMALAKRLGEGRRGPLSIITVIEAVEQLFLLDKHDGEAVARQRLEARMPVFHTLADLPELSARERAQIQHHEGKALNRLNRPTEAAERFEAVLAGPFPMDAARLQLVTIYRSKPEKSDETIALVDTVFARWEAGEDVAYSVILGLIERLPAGEGRWRNDVIARHADAIKKTIVEASNVGVGHGPRAFAPLGRFISTEMPVLFEEIFRHIPTPVLHSVGADGDRFAWAEIYAEAARVPGLDAKRLRATALDFYEAIAKPAGFHIQRKAELLIDMGLASAGEVLLGPLIVKGPSEWVDRLLARSRLAQGDAAGALDRIDSAIDRLKAKHFHSEFLELRHDIRAALGDPAAGDDLLMAFSMSQKAAETKRLAERLREAGVEV